VTDEHLSTPGRRMRLLRRAKGLKQAQLAALVHTSQPAISQWEHDKWLPGIAMQRLLAEALGADRAFLFGEITEKCAS
jgi:transcriptional regulator with XRE-family HTH domain